MNQHFLTVTHWKVICQTIFLSSVCINILCKFLFEKALANAHMIDTILMWSLWINIFCKLLFERSYTKHTLERNHFLIKSVDQHFSNFTFENPLVKTHWRKIFFEICGSVTAGKPSFRKYIEAKPFIFEVCKTAFSRSSSFKRYSGTYFITTTVFTWSQFLITHPDWCSDNEIISSRIDWSFL